MSGHMMRSTVPTPGVNKLTERLLAQGVKLDDPSTWPEGVWRCEIGNFGYSREWRFMPTWESPCGLLLHGHGDMWGDTWVDGEFKCSENDNPLFRCPVPGKPCEHRLRLPPGINCQFHRTDREWREEDSAERLYRRYDDMLRREWEERYRAYPGWNGVCACLKQVDLPDGTATQTAAYNVDKCIGMGCQSVQCVCRNGAERDISKANIFYDLYYEWHYVDGFLEHVEKKLSKGLKVFDKPVARTDAEIALKMWRHDPDSPLVPMQLRNKLNAATGDGREDVRDRFFIAHHQCWREHTQVTLTVEVRDIRIGKNEQRDMLKDLQDVQDGIEVEHRSDAEKAAKAKKSQDRRDRKVRKLAAKYVNAMERERGFQARLVLSGLKDEMRYAVEDEAERILGKRREKAEKQAREDAQITMWE